jgi:predicted CoA-binding protein
MNPTIQDFIQGKRFAIVGVSRSGKKFGNSIYTEMKARGYQLFVVHPEMKEIDGQPCYTSLSDLSDKVDGVIICVPPQKAGQVLRDAAQAGITRIWLQQGAQSPEVLALAKELNLHPVTGKCILMYVDPVTSIHSWHRTFAKVFGQY